jgi:hypothetical protein
MTVAIKTRNGPVCRVHPELNGAQVYRGHKWWCKPCNNKHTSEKRRQRVIDQGTYTYGTVCAIHGRLMGKRYTRNHQCVGCSAAAKPDYKLTTEYLQREHEENKRRVLIKAEKTFVKILWENNLITDDTYEMFLKSTERDGYRVTSKY